MDVFSEFSEYITFGLLGVNLLCIFLHKSSKAGWNNQFN